MRDLLKELADLGKMVNKEVNAIHKEIVEINKETKDIQRERFKEMWKCIDECNECVEASGIDFAMDILTARRFNNHHGSTTCITIRIDGKKWRDGATLCFDEDRICVGRLAREFDKIQQGISSNWWDHFGKYIIEELLWWNENDSEAFKMEFAKQFTKRMEDVLRTERNKKDEAKRNLAAM